MKYLVTVNGKQYEVEVEKIGGVAKSLTRQPLQRGENRVQEVQANQHKETQAPVVESKEVQKKSGNGVEITSPMPGVILDIKVKVGDSVKYGQCLAILEAMKMENDIPATQDGVVEEILVKKGDTVDTDAVLIVLK